MSKLLDRLDHITRGPIRTLGFAPASARETLPTLALLATLKDPNANVAKRVVENGVDAVIFIEAAEQESVASLPEGAVWGVETQALNKEKADKLRSQSCDFIVFGLENTLAEALEEGDCGRILRVASDLEEAKLRVLEDLPVDIVVVNVPAIEGPLNLTHLLAIANVRNATGRYLLLEWDASLSQGELEQLRDLGVDGILAAGDDIASVVSTLRERIDALPPRRPRSEREQKGTAVLPRLEGAGLTRRPPEPDEDDDDGWDEP